VDGEFLETLHLWRHCLPGEDDEAHKEGHKPWERKLRILSAGKQTIVAGLEQVSL
jgi:hypothetical protein